MQTTPDAARPAGAVFFFFMVLISAAGAITYVLWDFATDLVIGFLLAGVCRPLYLRTLQGVRGRAWLAAALITTLVAVAVAIPTVYLIASLSQQAGVAFRLLQSALASDDVHAALRGEGWVGSRVQRVFELFGMEYSPDTVRAAASKAASGIASSLSNQLNAAVSNVLGVFYHFAMMLVVVYYGLLDGPAVKRRVFDLSPLPDEEEELIVQKFKDVGIAILLGNGVASLLQGALGGLAMWAAGLATPMFWGAIIAVFAFLPLIGTNIVVIPATLFLIFDQRWFAAIAFFAFTNLQGVFIDNIVKTKLMGSRMQMHTLLLFLALLGGISAFGFAGLLYGPLIAAFFVTTVELYERGYRTKLFRGGHFS